MKVAAVEDTEAEDTTTTTSSPPLAIAVAVAIPSAPPLDNDTPNKDNALPQTDEEAQAW